MTFSPCQRNPPSISHMGALSEYPRWPQGSWHMACQFYFSKFKKAPKRKRGVHPTMDSPLQVFVVNAVAASAGRCQSVRTARAVCLIDLPQHARWSLTFSVGLHTSFLLLCVWICKPHGRTFLDATGSAHCSLYNLEVNSCISLT